MTSASPLPDWQLKRSRRRTMELRVYPSGRVEVRAPLAASEASIEAFVKQRRHWLAAQLQKIREQPPAKSWQCRQGASLFFRGEPLELAVTEGPA